MAEVRFDLIEKIKYFYLAGLYAMDHEYLNDFMLKILHSETY
jgi:hypothetical protein